MKLPPVPRVPMVPVRGGGAFGVRRIWCVGRNFAAHAREMGGDPVREPPFFFAKPADTVLTGGAPLRYPPGTADLQPEIELVAAIGLAGAGIPAERALAHVWGYAAGLDMTRRDLQAEAKRAGRPWEMGKAFDHAAPIGLLCPATEIGHPVRGAIRLSVNGQARQSGDLSALIWPVAAIVAALSRLVALGAGDLIFTGTPAGVRPVLPGDQVLGEIEGVGEVRAEILAAAAEA